MNQNDESEVKAPSQPARVVATPQQAGDTRAPWWWVERCVWTERMLTRLAASESADRVWFRLWDKTDAPANLASAFHKVWKKGGSAGADEQTVAHFGRRAEAELQQLHEQLHEQLREGTYRPQPVRRAWIDQPGSTEKRPLGIPAVGEQAGPAPHCAARMGPGPAWSRRSLPGTATASVRGAGPFEISNLKFQISEAGHVWVVDADLKSYFDTIPHERLLALVAERVGDGRVLEPFEISDLKFQISEAGVLEEARG